MKTKYPLPNSCRWALWKWADIPSKSNPELVYLRRLRVVQTPAFSVYIHWINEPDTDRYPHDHPWNFWSLILRGEYSELVYDYLGDTGYPQRWRRWSLHKMPLNKAHRITEAAPGLVTLVVTGRRRRVFCFWVDDHLVPWHRMREDEGEMA